MHTRLWCWRRISEQAGAGARVLSHWVPEPVCQCVRWWDSSWRLHTGHFTDTDTGAGRVGLCWSQLGHTTTARLTITTSPPAHQFYQFQAELPNANIRHLTRPHTWPQNLNFFDNDLNLNFKIHKKISIHYYFLSGGFSIFSRNMIPKIVLKFNWCALSK